MPHDYPNTIQAFTQTQKLLHTYHNSLALNIELWYIEVKEKPMANTISYRNITKNTASQDAREFCEVCTNNSALQDLTTNIRRADRTDMREWNISASEWHWAVRQAAFNIVNN